MLKYIVLAIILFQTLAISAKSKTTCNGYYATGDTSIYIDIINYLVKSELLKPQDLKLIHSSLAMGKLENPLRYSTIRNRNDFQEIVSISHHLKLLQDANKLNTRSIKKVIENKLRTKSEQKLDELYRRSFTLSNTTAGYYEPDFVRVYSENHKSLNNSSMYNFEILATQVSQGMFYKILGYNPSIGVNEKNATLIDQTRLLINTPVNGLKKIDIYHFFETLNYLAKNNSILINELMPGHVNGMFYRPASSAEWKTILENSTPSKNNRQSASKVKINISGEDHHTSIDSYKSGKRYYMDQEIYDFDNGMQEITADLSVRKEEKQETMLSFWNTFFSKNKYQNFMHSLFDTISQSQFMMNNKIYPTLRSSTFVDPSPINENSDVTFRIVRYFPEFETTQKKHSKYMEKMKSYKKQFLNKLKRKVRM